MMMSCMLSATVHRGNGKDQHDLPFSPQTWPTTYYPSRFKYPCSPMASSPNFSPHHRHPVPMITMRAQLAPALLLLLMVAAAPLISAMTAEEETKEKLLQGAHKEDLADKLSIANVDPDAYAAEQKSVGPDSKKQAAKDVVDNTSYIMGAVPEKKPESKSDEKKLKEEAKVIAQVKGETNYEDAVAEQNAKEEKKSKLKSDISEDDDAEEKEKKSKNKDDDEDKEKKSKNKDDDDVEKKEKNSKSKDEDSIYDTEKKSKNKDDDDDDEKKDKKSKSKDDDDDDDDEKKENKLKNKDDDDDDEKKEKKVKNKDDDDDEKKKEKKSKEKSDSSEDDDAEKKSKSKGESYEDDDDNKKSKSKNKASEEDFDAVPMEAKADESMPAVDTPNGYQAPTTKTKPQLPAADTPDGHTAPTTAQPKVSAADTPDGYATPTTQMSAIDTPDGYVTPSKAQLAMSATDSPDGNVPATDSPDGNVPATDSPDGYATPTKPEVDVQSYSETVPQPVLRMLSPLVKSMCARTSYPYECDASIARLPETTAVPGRQKNLLGVLTLAIDAVRAKIVEAKNAATDVSKDPHVDKLAKGAIKDCISNYDDMNYEFDSALTALKRGDKGTAGTALDAARTAVDTCDEGFLDRPQLKPILGGYEKVLAEFSSNVLAINANAKKY
ncbi:hypothetical protein CFC21_057218 [Triticum aestivum]|uniref:Pectinesterase inhibitor domain-containing protein n=2 Tax=Triticum aestivum TaxID=4565 RepID=A0A9R1GKL4_WHEAT|nr:protein starmaker-like [Triticum aestivum]KAF7048458.1 hypothetical protein CFC21_057218 [Triticum aestivum]